MHNQANEFRQRLLNDQEMSPALRASYEEELDHILRPKLTPRLKLIGVSLLVPLVVCTLALVRNMIMIEARPLTLVSWAILAAAFSYSSYLILRDLRQKKHSPKSVSSIAQALYFAAASITVVALLIGLQKPADPASTFNAFFLFVFYVACLAWTIETRIAAAELSAREQMLRIEYRLADLAEKLGQAKS
jgi:hypothetical protein